MGTITERKRKNGKPSFMAQVIKKQRGNIVWREAKTFTSKREAKAWAAWREAEMDKPGAVDALRRPSTTLADAIDRYVTTKTDIGRTKAQCLRSIKEYKIASMDCAAITASDISAFASDLSSGDRKPQTVGNYVSHLSAVFRDARILWGFPLDYQAMRDAQAALTRHETIRKSAKRDRRPTLSELDRIMQHFVDRQQRAPRSAPMHKIIAFAIFSTRRQDEILRVHWRDLDERHSRLLVRDMKHPGQKHGNDVMVELPAEALRIIKAMPQAGEQIFPFGNDAVSAAFTRACQFLEIEDLHFHDLRHEGISRLFEMGRTIPLAASVSGHRSWNSLQRYTQIMEAGDKYDGWKWLDVVAPPTQESA